MVPGLPSLGTRFILRFGRQFLNDICTTFPGSEPSGHGIEQRRGRPAVSYVLLALWILGEKNTEGTSNKEKGRDRVGWVGGGDRGV